MILTNCENLVIENANLEARNISSMFEEITKDVHQLIYFINTLKEETLVNTNLPERDDCIFSFGTIKEKHGYMPHMKEEFE